MRMKHGGYSDFSEYKQKGNQMKIAIAVIALTLCSARADILDLGPNGSTFYRAYDYSGLNGTQLNGQTVSVDLIFSTQVHLFQGTWPDFLIGLAVETSGGESFITGTGYALDASGNPVGGGILGSANSTNLMYVGLFPVYYGLTRPSNIYGVHFEVTLPELDATITAGGIELFDNTVGQPFRIGPILPDEGSTIFLTCISLVAIVGAEYYLDQGHKRQWRWKHLTSNSE